MIESFWNEAQTLLPEIILGISCLCFLLLGAWYGNAATEPLSKVAEYFLLPLLIGLLCVIDVTQSPSVTFEGLVVSSAFTRFLKIMILGAVLVLLDVHRRYMRQDQIEGFEVPILMLFAALGMMVMVSADHLLSFFIGLELQSLSIYILVGIRRGQGREGEAAVKYFVLGALSTALILFGSSYIYGFLGTASFEGIASGLLAEESIPPLVYAAMGLIIAGLAFKMSIVPFHMWTPDVYEGSPLIVTAFLAAAPKIAAFALFIRLLVGPFLPFLEAWQMLIAVLSGLSMILGVYAALYQTNIKRLLAYSSISHMGFALVGIVSGDRASVESTLTYLVLYLTIVLTTFICLLNLRRQGQLINKVNDLAGLSKGSPVLAACIGVMMFSLAGIPPLAGFFAKFTVFKSAVQGGYTPLVVIGLLASVVGAVYYLRIVKIMYFDHAIGGDVALAFDRKMTFSSGFMILLGVFISLFFLVYPQLLMQPIQVAARALI